MKTKENICAEESVSSQSNFSSKNYTKGRLGLSMCSCQHMEWKENIIGVGTPKSKAVSEETLK